MRLTSKGQVTVPIAVRDELGLLPGTEVEIEVVGQEARIRKVAGPGPRGRSVVRHLRGRAPTGMSTDQILALTRSEA